MKNAPDAPRRGVSTAIWAADSSFPARAGQCKPSVAKTVDPEVVKLISPGQRPGYLWPSRSCALKGSDECGWRNVVTPFQGYDRCCARDTQGGALVVLHKRSRAYDPGQLVWPVNKFERLRGASGHPLCSPVPLGPPEAAPGAQGEPRRKQGSLPSFSPQTAAPAGRAGRGPSS